MVNNVKNINGTDISNILSQLPEFDETMVNNLVDTAKNSAADFLGQPQLQPQIKINRSRNPNDVTCNDTCQKLKNLQHVQKISLNNSINDIFSIPKT